MQFRTLLLGGLAAVIAVPGKSGAAQQRERERERERAREREDLARARADELEEAGRDMREWAHAFTMDDGDRPRLGISTEASGLRDTLGVLVTDVTKDGPAAKAGIEEGDRIQSVNGVNLRLSREDAGEEDMQGVATRRLIRTLGKAKIGDEVDLRVWSNGAVKSVKVKTVSAEDLERFRYGEDHYRFGGSNRASLGIGLGSMGSRRDTLGVLITSVTPDGPAEKAGLIEGDRIQSINGVDLRVPAEDAGDMGMAASRWRRLTRELEKAKAGDEVELRVYSGGSSKTVRVKTVRQGELREHGGAFFFNDGVGAFPRAFAFPRGEFSLPLKAMLRPGIMQLRVTPDVRVDVTPQVAPRIVIPKVAPTPLAKIRRVITI